MNTVLNRCASRHLLAAAAMALLLIAHPFVIAGPGAHGPNGEHLDGPTAMRPASALPRVEAKSEAFELVAELRASELVIVIDRFESNEPVLGAQLEVESGALKAVATFRAEQGDYAVTDAALLKALAAPGEHALVFTLVAGKDSDLLDGTLVRGEGGGSRDGSGGGAGSAAAAATGAAKDDHAHAHGSDAAGHDHDHSDENPLKRAAWIGAGIAAVGLLGGISWWRQRRREAGKTRGGL